ncbi:uncharacterized protein LOC135108516 isoform X3 [Scylla paramamosain]|uniref:uncharacterized protein LOC135108516 isoform X3 n=1 Tax=Scylla paramamosain TaxID=85552 RepID=UPI003082FBA7
MNGVYLCTERLNFNNMDGKLSPEEGKKREESKEGYITRWKSVIPCPPVPDTNLASFLLREMANHGGKQALVDAVTGQHYTYSDICAMVPRVCANLAAAGVSAGDAVLLVSPNGIEFPIAQLAIQLLPATCVAASPFLSPDELVHVMRVGMASWAVVDESVLGVIEKVTTMLPNTLREIWVIGSSSKSHPSFYSLMKTERWAAWPPQVENSSFNPAREVALMQFSSGTTGLTKGVMLSHRNLLTLYMQVKCFVEDVDNKKKASGEPDSEADILSRVLLFIPLHHNYATVTFNFVVTVGGCCVMMKTFSPHSFFNALQKYKITYAPIVPHIANFLLHTPLLKEYDITSLKSLISASAPLPPSTKQALTTRMGCAMRQGYGLTETCAGVATTIPHVYSKMGSVGRVMPYLEVKERTIRHAGRWAEPVSMRAGRGELGTTLLGLTPSQVTQRPGRALLDSSRTSLQKGQRGAAVSRSPDQRSWLSSKQTGGVSTPVERLGSWLQRVVRDSRQGRRGRCG